MQKFTLDVSKKQDGKYVSVGTVDIHYPLLSELGFNVEPNAPVLGADGLPVNQGLPVYADEKHQFAFDAIFAAVKADARNKLVSGTATLKDGATIASTMEELLAVAERDGAALKALRDMLAGFKEYLKTTGKATATQEAILSLASNRKSLTLQPAEKKAKFQVYIHGFAGTLSADQASVWAKPLAALDAACEAVDGLDDM